MSIMDIGTSLFVPELCGQLKLGYMAETKRREEGLNQNEIQNIYVFTIGFSQKLKDYKLIRMALQKICNNEDLLN